MDLERLLRAAFVLRAPKADFEEAVMARVSAGARRARAPSRIILIGTILAVAAATLLVTRVVDTSPPRQPAASLVLEPVPAPEAEVVEVVSPAPAVSVGPPVMTEGIESKPADSPVRPFTVRLTTLLNEAKDPASKAAVEVYLAALVEALRKVPGLNLVVADPAAAAGGSSSAYDIAIKASGSAAENKLDLQISASAAGRSPYPLQANGALAPRCGTPGCGTPEDLANFMVGMLGQDVFPASPSRLRDMRAQFLDTSQPINLRVALLGKLGSMQADGVQDPDRRQSGTKRAANDAAVVRGAIDLAATTTEGRVREQVWRAMRGVRDNSLVQPLLRAFQDTNHGVRTAALSTLVADFAENPDVRVALEAAARDSSPAIRVMAQRALVGEAAWNRQVVASLKDTSLPAAARTEALFYTLRNVTPRPALGEFLTDDAAIRAFATLYPKAVASPLDEDLRGLRSDLQNSLGSIDHPAITDLLLGNLANGTESSTRRQAAAQLASHRDEPRVRAALEKASSEDADMAVRERARKALDPAAQPPAR